MKQVGFDDNHLIKTLLRGILLFFNGEENLEKKLALESEKTKKAREKLRKKLESLEQKITPQALERKSLEIGRWIERHAPQRVILKQKMSLFDENKNTAEVSAKVAKLAINIQRGVESSIGEHED